MPQEYSKKEIVRHVNELIEQIKNKTYKSPLSQEFAEVYIEDGQSDQNGEPLPSRAPLPNLPPRDATRDRFAKMRRLADAVGYFGSANDRLQAVLFYKQAKFMEDFEDDYTGDAEFSMYFPNYQMMSYEQLRTYFTWRGNVRRGIVNETSLSYVFVYIYELIHNVGVSDCEDGLDKLAFIWGEYRVYEKKLDRYMNGWIKDYYITNDFPALFDQYLQKVERLEKLYKRSTVESLFDYYDPYSDYKIKKSAFFSPQTERTIAACFDYCVKALDAYMRGQNAEFEDLIFYGKGNVWAPFSKALYSSSSRQTKNKVIRISDTEKYFCEDGRWTSTKNRIQKENGRFIIGYILKRIEQFFRKATKYKYKLNADPKKISVTEIGKLLKDPESLFAQIDTAIYAFYRDLQKITVSVDFGQLETIRANALMIQEKLLVNDEDSESEIQQSVEEPKIRQPEPARVPDANAGDPWSIFAGSLDDIEATAVRMILENAPLQELHVFAKTSGLMLEVLIDHINQKAIELVRDNILEFSDELTVYEDYQDELKRVIGS